MESKSEIDVFSLVAIGTMGILILVSFIVLFVLLYQKKMLANIALIKENDNIHQRRLLDASIEVAEQERKKIAANIHDDVGMMLNVLKLNLTKIQRNRNDEILTETLLTNSNLLIGDTLAAIRIISNDLMPPTLVKLGFIKGITELCRQVKLSGAIDIYLKLNVDSIQLEKKNEIQLYRLIKEVINNIIKHASASTTELTISATNEFMTITITHDGKGLSNEMMQELAESSDGIGLKSILSRAQLTNSVLQYIIIGNKESKIIIETPLVII
ncbi:MAG: ATP-binding protein [Bacteroidota bacterium]